MNNTKNILLSNLDKIHTTEMGFDRINKNLGLNTTDVVSWCMNKITDKKSIATKKGKNWYVRIDNYEITINANSFTIITAHIIKTQ